MFSNSTPDPTDDAALKAYLQSVQETLTQMFDARHVPFLSSDALTKGLACVIAEIEAVLHEAEATAAPTD